MMRAGHLSAPLLAAGTVILMWGIATAVGIRINTSFSLPLGLYIVTADKSAQLIEFCPAEPFASQSSARGYRTRGFACPDGAVPFLKPIVAAAGDIVAMSAEGIAVNGNRLPRTRPLTSDSAGRPLQSWPTGVYQVDEGFVWVASTHNRGSYDSRYMGPIDARFIRRRLKSLWVLGKSY
jgi:conjugative transfer signal peptidase TraF